MGKRGGSIGNSGTMGNGGIMGSGVFGLFGSTIVCKAEDESIYCSFVKIINMIFMSFILFFILYLVYNVLTMWFRTNRGTGRRS